MKKSNAKAKASPAENKPQPVKGYKVFLPDFKAKERGFQYAENTEFTHDGPIRICASGFHFCTKASHCFNYYDFNPENIVCEVEGRGEIITHEEDSKVCTNVLYIGRRLTWPEVLILANEGKDNTGHSNSGNRNSGNWNSGNWNSGDRNSGNRNSGDRNSGNWNSGNWNSGDRNSGNWNSGNRNSGDWNSGYRNSGAFCINPDPELYLFDKPSGMTVRQWERSEAVQIMSSLLELCIWVPAHAMSAEEKKANPKYETTEGYLKTITIKEAWANMWGNLTAEKKAVFTSLKNFDAKIFEELTGIKVA